MTNYEKYKDDVIKGVVYDGTTLALIENKPQPCYATQCSECEFSNYRNTGNDDCSKRRKAWLNAEYKEQITLTEREHAFCVLMETGYIARDNTEALYYYDEKPLKGRSVWHQNSGTRKNFAILDISKKLQFHFIKWSDPEPYSIEELLNMPVKESGE